MRRPALTVLALITIGGAAAPSTGSGQAPLRAQDSAAAARAVARSARAVEHAALVQRGRSDRFEQIDRQTRTVKIGATGEIDLANVAGDIIVTKGGGSEAKIDILKKSRARTEEEAREMLSLVQVDLAERPGRVEIRTRYPHEQMTRERRSIHVSVTYTIAAPAGARVTVKTISGEVRVTDIVGDLTLETVSGNIRISGANRINLAKTISGNVEIADTRSEAALDAGSVSGSVILNRVKARRMDVGTVSGNVGLTEVDCDRIDAHTMSGDIEFGGQLAKNGRYGLRTHSGNLRVLLAGTTGFEVDASTFSGNVRSDLPLAGQTPITSVGGPRGRGPRGQSLRGMFGDGSAVLELRTFSGDVLISKR
jgi:DUF4097 and DUF4098 domain-containing protein YvlB